VALMTLRGAIMLAVAVHVSEVVLADPAASAGSASATNAQATGASCLPLIREDDRRPILRRP
jgi:hypothetical protein